MANEFKVRKGLIVQGSGSTGDETILNVQGNQGQLFSVTDSLVGDIFTVSDISGIPILNVSSSGVVEAGTFGNYGLTVNGTNVTSSGNISASGTITAEGLLISDDATITDNLTVNGTTNLDVVDIDGTVTIANNTKILGETTVGIGRDIAYITTGNRLILGNTLMGTTLTAGGGNLILDSSGYCRIDSATGRVELLGQVTASGNISASGDLIANRLVLDQGVMYKEMT